MHLSHSLGIDKSDCGWTAPSAADQQPPENVHYDTEKQLARQSWTEYQVPLELLRAHHPLCSAVCTSLNCAIEKLEAVIQKFRIPAVRNYPVVFSFQRDLLAHVTLWH